MPLNRTTALVLALLVAQPASTQELAPAPRAADPPWVGVWRVEHADLLCSEQLELEANGATTLSSGRARSEATSLVVPGAQPAGGYFRWEITAQRRNSEPDCTGKLEVLEGFRANYLRILDNGARLLLCEEEEASACFNLLVRVDGRTIADSPLSPSTEFGRTFTAPRRSDRRSSASAHQSRPCAGCTSRTRSSPANRPTAAPLQASDG